MNFRVYRESDYELLIDFLVRINKENKKQINWNWGRLEWMIEHPNFDKEKSHLIGLWFDKEELIAAAIFDMYPGEASLLAKPGYENLLDEMIDYAINFLGDGNGLGIYANVNDERLKGYLKKYDFIQAEEQENIMSISLKDTFEACFTDEFTLKEPKMPEDLEEVEWTIYQGFDHGEDRDAFVAQRKECKIRPHVNPSLNLLVKTKEGKSIAFCSLWYLKDTDYAYLEPLCVIPSYRKKGIAKSLVYSLLNRVRKLGAKKVYVISDSEFYKKIGFEDEENYVLFYKFKRIEVNSKFYEVERLLGKGKGGYSFLTNRDGNKVVVKQMHHEPCDYYEFGDKIQTELKDYKRLEEVGIRIPKLLDVDEEKERLVKEYINGPTIALLVRYQMPVDKYIPQVEEMAKLARKANLNIDYYPTNFIVQDDLLYYVDFECNAYTDEWSFDNWGRKYWGF